MSHFKLFFVYDFSLLMRILLPVTELYLLQSGLQDVLFGLNDEFHLWVCYSIVQVRQQAIV